MSDNKEAIHKAVLGNDLEAIKELLEAGADVEAKNKYGDTPLHRAAYYGHEKVVAALLGAGADVNAKTELGETPLQCAAYYGHTKVVKLLEKHTEKMSNFVKSLEASHILGIHQSTLLRWRRMKRHHKNYEKYFIPSTKKKKEIYYRLEDLHAYVKRTKERKLQPKCTKTVFIGQENIKKKSQLTNLQDLGCQYYLDDTKQSTPQLIDDLNESLLNQRQWKAVAIVLGVILILSLMR